MSAKFSSDVASRMRRCTWPSMDSGTAAARRFMSTAALVTARLDRQVLRGCGAT